MRREDLLDLSRLMMARPGNWYETMPRLADGTQALKAWYDASQPSVASQDAAISFTAACKHYLSCASNATLQTGDIDFEVGGWVYPDSVTGDQRFLAKYHTSSNREFYVGLSGVTVTATFSNDGLATPSVNASYTAAIGTWFFFRAWHDSVGNTINLQINNGAIASVAHTTGVYVGTSPFTLGASSVTAGGANYFSGRLDSIYFTKRISTSGEATALYNSGYGRRWEDCTAANGLDTFATNCVSFWNGSETSGTRYDSKGTNHLSEVFDPIIDSASTLGSELVVNGGFEDVFTEKVTNGGFASDTGSWTAGSSATLASVAGGQSGNCLEVTNGATAYGYAYQTFTTVAGQKYNVTFYFKKGTATDGRLYVGTTPSGLDLVTSGAMTDAAWAAKALSFTATGTTTYISCNNGSNTSGHTSYFDSVSVTYAGWTAVNAVISSETGGQSGRCLQVANSGTNYGYAYQAFTTVANQNYTLSYYFKKGTAVAGMVRIGTAMGGFDIYDGSTSPLTDANWALYSRNFKATSTTTYIRLGNLDNTDTYTSLFDSISVKPLTQTNLNGGFESLGAGETLGAELLSNPGFETAGGGAPDYFANWTESAGSGAIDVATVAIHGGLSAAKLSYTGGQSNIGEGVTVTAATRYKLTFWTRGDGTKDGQYRIGDNSNGGDVVARVSTGVTGTTYTQVTKYITTPAGCVSIGVYLYSPDAAGIAYFDDISVKQVTAYDIFQNWTESVAGSSEIVAGTASPYAGTYNCRLDVDAANSNAQVTQSVCVAAKKYTLSLYAKASSGTPTLWIGGGTAGSSTTVTLTTSYALYSATLTIDAAILYLQRVSAASKSIYIDSVSLYSAEIVSAAGIALGPAEDASLAASFNGTSQYLYRASNASLQTGDIDFTVWGWCKLSSKSLGNAGTIAAKYCLTGNQREYRLYHNLTTDRFTLGVSPDGTSTGLGEVIDTNFGAPAINAWAFVVAWHDSVANKLWIQTNNGTAVSASWTLGFVAGTGQFGVGRLDNTSSGYYFPGSIANVGFIKRVLTASERTAIFANGHGCKYAALPSTVIADAATYSLSYWQCDERSAGTAPVTRLDSGPGANHLTDSGNTPSEEGPAYPACTVSKLLDSSGFGRHLTQTDLTKRLIWRTNQQNGKPAFVGNGGDDSLMIAADIVGTGDISAYAIFNASAWGGGNAGRLWSNGKFILYVNSSGYLSATSDGATIVNSGAASIALSTTYIVIVTRTSAGVLNYYVNGVPSGSANLASGTPAAGAAAYLGNSAAGTAGFAGNLYAAGLYGAILSSAQLAALTTRAKSVWSF